MERIELSIGGKDFVFAVDFEDDYDAGAPWEMADGHGPVSDWTERDKRPGELLLNSRSRNTFTSCRYYDFAEACRIALRDGWDAAPYNDGTETKRQQAARAARADFEYMRAWCNDEWRYVGVVVTLLDPQGEKTEVSDSLWAVETLGDHHHETARQLADELAHGYGVRWTEAEKPTYEYLAREGA